MEEDTIMKTLFRFFALAICLATIAISCQKNPEMDLPEEQVIEENPNLVTLKCAFPALDNENGTKVTLDADGKTAWEADVDAIVFQGCPKTPESASIAPIVHTFTSAELANPAVASFSVDLSSLRPDSDDGSSVKQDYNVAYPASIWSSYSSSHMYGRSSFSNTNKMLMAGYVDGSSIVLKHVTAAIVFKVAGDYDAYIFEGNGDAAIVGYSKLVVEVNKPNVTSYRKKYKQDNGTAGPLTTISGDVVSDGSTVNTIFLPVNTKRSGEDPYTYEDDNADGGNVVYLPNGFTIKLLQGGVIKKYITSSAPLTIRPGHMIDLGVLPAEHFHDYEAIPAAEKDDATELSKPKSANCYVVDGSVSSNKNKVFKFPAVQGNTYVYGGASGTSVGTVSSVDIVWETWNNAESVTANSVIKIVDYKEGFVYFKMPSTLHAGNALIAAKDSGDNILWSWHIWVPSSTVGTSADGYGGKTQNGMMDRNLGALEVTEDNPAAADIVSAGLMYQWGRKDPFMGPSAFGTNEPAKVSGTAKSNVTEQMTVAESIKNPTVFVAYNGDWTSETDNNFWADDSPSNKTIYDPCPAGYRVPQRNTSLTFWNSTTLSDQTDWDLDAEHYWFKVFTPAAVFPISGYIYKNGGYANSGVEAYIWSSHKGSDTVAYAKRLKSDGTTKNEQPVKATGAAVRCVAK